eukprot:Skav206402  [mRNA]  locus=scaffold2210:48295:63478:+ [translate_table: standard]
MHPFCPLSGDSDDDGRFMQDPMCTIDFPPALGGVACDPLSSEAVLIQRSTLALSDCPWNTCDPLSPVAVLIRCSTDSANDRSQVVEDDTSTFMQRPSQALEADASSGYSPGPSETGLTEETAVSSDRVTEAPEVGHQGTFFHQLGHAFAHAQTTWHNWEELMHSASFHTGLPIHDIVAVYHVSGFPVGIPEGSEVVLLHALHDRPIASRQKHVLLDFCFYDMNAFLVTGLNPHVDRSVILTEPWLTRDQFLHQLGLDVLPNDQRDRILIHANDELWPRQDGSFHEFTSGDYVRVHIPPPSSTTCQVVPHAIPPLGSITPTISFQAATPPQVSNQDAAFPALDMTHHGMVINTWFINHRMHRSCILPRSFTVRQQGASLLHALCQLWYDLCDHSIDLKATAVRSLHIDNLPTVFQGRLNFILEQEVFASRSACIVSVMQNSVHPIGIPVQALSLPHAVNAEIIHEMANVQLHCHRLHSCVTLQDQVPLDEIVREPTTSGSYYQVQFVRASWSTPVIRTAQEEAPSLMQLSASSHTAPEPPINHDDRTLVLHGYTIKFVRIRDIFQVWTAFAATEMLEEGPVAYFQSYYVHGSQHPVCMRGRATRLLEDVAEWHAEIVETWADLLSPEHPIWVTLVLPRPPVGHNTGRAGHLVVHQAIDMHSRAYHLTEIGGSHQPYYSDAGRWEDCELASYECQVWHHGARVDTMPVQSHHGLGLVITVQRLAPESALASSEGGLQGSSALQHGTGDHRTSPLAHPEDRPERSASPSCSAPPNHQGTGVTNCTVNPTSPTQGDMVASITDEALAQARQARAVIDAPLPEGQSGPLREQEFWVQDLHTLALSVALAGVEESPTFVVVTWFIDFVDLPQCTPPRAITLDFGEYARWLQQFKALWADVYSPLDSLDVDLITPMPQAPPQLPIYGTQLILHQRSSSRPEHRALHFSIDIAGAQDQAVLVVDHNPTGRTLMRAAELEAYCLQRDRPLTCHVRHGERQIPLDGHLDPTRRIGARTGFGITLVVPHIQHPETSEVSMLQLPSRSGQHSPASDSLVQPGQQTEPELLLLDECLPKPRITVAFDCVTQVHEELLRRSLPTWVDWPQDLDWQQPHLSELAALPPWDGTCPLQYWFYTDGSAGKGQCGSSAVFLIRTATTIQLGGVLATPLHPCTSVETEEAATTWAMIWAYQLAFWHRSTFPMLAPTFHFHFDSVVAGYQAEGQWTNYHQPQWQTLQRSLGQALDVIFGTTCTHWTHVRAHQGLVWNEAADLIAKWASEQTVDHAVELLAWGTDRATPLQWLWARELMLSHHPCLPSLHCDTIVQELDTQSVVLPEPQPDTQATLPPMEFDCRFTVITANVQQDLCHVAQHIVLPFDLPDSEHWPWDDFIGTFRRKYPLKALVRRWLRRHLLQESMQHEVKHLHDAIHHELAAHEVRIVVDTPHATDQSSVEVMCELCSKAFSNSHLLSLHMWHKHGQMSAERSYLASDTCPGCLKKCWSTHRLVQHLKYRRNHCWDRVITNRQPLDDPASISMPLHFQHVKRIPSIREVLGPLPPTSREKRRALVLTDLWCHEQHGVELGIHLTRADCLRLWPTQWAMLNHSVASTPRGDLEDHWLALLSELPHLSDVQATAIFWCWAHTEPTWPSGELRLRALRFAAHFEQAHYHTRLAHLRQRVEQLSAAADPEDDHPPRREPNPRPVCNRCHPIVSSYQAAPGWEQKQRKAVVNSEVRWQPGLNHQCRVLIHLYSGHRRMGDFHAWAQSYVRDLPGHYVVISVDTSISAKMNILQPEVWKGLLQLARDGIIHGLLLGPPCETWSSARHEDIPGKPFGPRPLRHADAPWGLLQLTVRELRQCRTGALLLLRGLWIATIVALRGGGVILEHPAEPRQVDRPSIWRLGIMQQLLSLSDVFSLVTVEQWKLGAAGVKPTTFLCANVDLQGPVEVCSLRHTLRPQQALIGLHQGGFRTSSAKAYPTRLCQALALALSTVKPCTRSMALSPTYRELLVEFASASETLGGLHPMKLNELPLMAFLTETIVSQEYIQPAKLLHWIHCITYTMQPKQERSGHIGAEMKDPQYLLFSRKGSPQAHAVLLCSVLLGMGRDAYVVKGTIQAPTSSGKARLLEHDGGWVTFWEPSTRDFYHLPRRWEPRKAAQLATVHRAIEEAKGNEDDDEDEEEDGAPGRVGPGAGGLEVAGKLVEALVSDVMVEVELDGEASTSSSGSWMTLLSDEERREHPIKHVANNVLMEPSMRPSQLRQLTNTLVLEAQEKGRHGWAWLGMGLGWLDDHR